MAFTFNNDYSAHASDEISIFLRQLLHRSSSSLPAAQSGQFYAGLPSSSAALPDTVSHLPVQSTMTIFDSDRTMVDRASAASENCCYPLSTCWSEVPPAVCSNLTSDSQAAGSVELRSTDNDADDYACDSEEEGLEEAQPNYKQNQVRNSSKRSRAAEVHNMSEKRRRSRINEKMKALQDLIPNSNKTDKASMLDEAIEYLKQLQLQVQMLSMRNGVILNPMCLPGFPGVFDPVQMNFNLSNIEGSSHPNILPSGSAPPNLCDPVLACAVTQEAPFSLQSSMDNIQVHLPTSSQQRIDDTVAQHQLSITPSQTNELVIDKFSQ